MSSTYSIYRKELRSYLVSPIPYVFIALFTGFMGWYVFSQSDFFLARQATLGPLFDVMPWAMVFLVPAITMRLWSEEARAGTMETLLTMPVRSAALVAGKFLAAWTLLLACLLGTIPMLITVSAIGDVDPGPVWSGYLGALLMGGALLAMGMWVSALTRHQIVAFLLTVVAAFGLVVLRGAARDVASPLGPLFENLSIASRYSSLGRGVVDFRDVLYFVTFMAFFLYLNAEAVENRRYR